MLFEHQGQHPNIHETAYIAPTATICGGVTVAAHSRILFGAVITAEGGPVDIGEHCIIMENAVIRGTPRHPTKLGNHVLVGPHAYLSGCTVDDNVFLAAGSTIFNGAHLGAGTEVRINGIVHLKTVLRPESVVPIGWIAVGDPVQILPPDKHDEIWAALEPLNFPKEIFGLERASSDVIMPQLTQRYSKFLGLHTDDTRINPES